MFVSRIEVEKLIGKSMAGQSGGSAQGMPVGTVAFWAMDDLPDGWLWCDGAPLPAENEFTPLRKIIGNNTPKVPDFYQAMDDDRLNDRILTFVDNTGNVRGLKQQRDQIRTNIMSVQTQMANLTVNTEYQRPNLQTQLENQQNQLEAVEKELAKTGVSSEMKLIPLKCIIKR
jgi:hypothetical protein